MTTPSRPSSLACVLQRLRSRARLLAAGLALVLPLAGCGLFHRDFDIAVGNRTASPVSIFANGEKVGDVGSNATATFTVEEHPLGRTTIDSGVNPVSTRPITQVTFSAQDLSTGAL